MLSEGVKQTETVEVSNELRPESNAPQPSKGNGSRGRESEPQVGNLALRPEQILDRLLPIRVRPTLNSMFDVLNGGVASAIDFLRRRIWTDPDNSERLKAFLKRFDELTPLQKTKFDLEQNAYELGIDPSELCGWMISEMHRFGRDMSSIIIETHKPYLAAKGIEEALSGENSALLERFLESQGVLLPKAPQTQVNVRANASSSSSSQSAAMTMEQGGLPSFHDEMKRVPSLAKSQQGQLEEGLQGEVIELPQREPQEVEFDVE